MKCRMAYDSSGGPTMQTEVYCMVRNYETVSFCSYCQVCIWRPTDNISQYAYGILNYSFIDIVRYAFDGPLITFQSMHMVSWTIVSLILSFQIMHLAF